MASKRLTEWMGLASQLEKTFVTQLLLSPSDVFKYLSIVSPDHFQNFKYGLLYDLVKKSQVEKIDLASLIARENIALSETIAEGYVSGRDMDSIATQIHQLSQARKLYGIMESGLHEIEYDVIPDFVAGFHDKFLKASRVKEQEVADAPAVIAEFERLQGIYTDKAINGDALIGFSCGFPIIDKFIDGFRPGHLWTIGGYTSTGKTFFSLNMVASAIEQGRRVVYYSLEMSPVDILMRLIGIMCNVSGTRVLKGSVTKEEAALVQEAKKKIVDSGLIIHSDIRDNDSIKLSMLEETLRRKVDLFMIDYIQLVVVKDQKDLYNTMRVTSTDMQTQAKVLAVPILLLSQVSNEAVRSKDTQVIGMKGAGDIAAVSDIAAELVLAEEDKEAYNIKLQNSEPISMKLAIKKNRHGDIGSLPFDFDKKTGRFIYEF